MSVSGVNKYLGGKAAAEAAVEFPGGSLVPWTFADESTEHVEEVVSGTVPAVSPYRVRVAKPLDQANISMAVGGTPRTKVTGGSPAIGQFAFNYKNGEISFHSSDTEAAFELTFVPYGTPIPGDWMHYVQGHIKEVEDWLAGLDLSLGQVVFVDGVKGNDSTGSGKSFAPFKSINAAMTAANGLEGSVLIRLAPFSAYSINGSCEVPNATTDVAIVGSGRENTIILVSENTIELSSVAFLSMVNQSPSEFTLDLRREPFHTNYRAGIDHCFIGGGPIVISNCFKAIHSKLEVNTINDSITVDDCEVVVSGSASFTDCLSSKITGNTYSVFSGVVRNSRIVEKRVYVSGSVFIGNTVDSSRFTMNPTSLSDVVHVLRNDLEIFSTSGETDRSLFNFFGHTGAINIKHCDFLVDLPFAETTDGGTVAVIQRFQCIGDFNLIDCNFVSSVIPVMDGHSKATLDDRVAAEPCWVEDCEFDFVVDGDDVDLPNDGLFSYAKYGHGPAVFMNCSFRTDASAAASVVEARGKQGALYISQSFTEAGAVSDVSVVDCRMDFKGHASAASRGVINADGGGTGTIQGEITGLKVLGEVNSDKTFLGDFGSLTVGDIYKQSGVITSDATIEGNLYVGKSVVGAAFASGTVGPQFHHFGDDSTGLELDPDGVVYLVAQGERVATFGHIVDGVIHGGDRSSSQTGDGSNFTMRGGVGYTGDGGDVTLAGGVSQSGGVQGEANISGSAINLTGGDVSVAEDLDVDGEISGGSVASTDSWDYPIDLFTGRGGPDGEDSSNVFISSSTTDEIIIPLIGILGHHGTIFDRIYFTHECDTQVEWEIFSYYNGSGGAKSTIVSGQIPDVDGVITDTPFTFTAKTTNNYSVYYLRLTPTAAVTDGLKIRNARLRISKKQL